MVKHNSYNVGDTIEYIAFGGERRVVVVEEKSMDIKNGRPGFDAWDCWGYDDQIVRVVSRGAK